MVKPKSPKTTKVGKRLATGTGDTLATGTGDTLTPEQITKALENDPKCFTKNTLRCTINQYGKIIPEKSGSTETVYDEVWNRKKIEDQFWKNKHSFESSMRENSTIEESNALQPLKRNNPHNLNRRHSI